MVVKHSVRLAKNRDESPLNERCPLNTGIMRVTSASAISNLLAIAEDKASKLRLTNDSAQNLQLSAKRPADYPISFPASDIRSHRGK